MSVWLVAPLLLPNDDVEKNDPVPDGGPSRTPEFLVVAVVSELGSDLILLLRNDSKGCSMVYMVGFELSLPTKLHC